MANAAKRVAQTLLPEIPIIPSAIRPLLRNLSLLTGMGIRPVDVGGRRRVITLGTGKDAISSYFENSDGTDAVAVPFENADDIVRLAKEMNGSKGMFAGAVLCQPAGMLGGGPGWELKSDEERGVPLALALRKLLHPRGRVGVFWARMDEEVNPWLREVDLDSGGPREPLRWHDEALTLLQDLGYETLSHRRWLEATAPSYADQLAKWALAMHGAATRQNFDLEAATQKIAAAAETAVDSSSGPLPALITVHTFHAGTHTAQELYEIERNQ